MKAKNTQKVLRYLTKKFKDILGNRKTQGTVKNCRKF